MSTYAHVVGGVVIEPLFTPQEGFTLDESFHADVAANWIDVTTVTPEPEQDWVYNGTTFSPPPAPPTPTPVQLATAALSAGLAISSASTPALNGTYSIDPATQNKIQAIALFIVVNSKFPGGQATYPWMDVSGSVHVFPSTTAFNEFASTIAEYVAALDFVIAGASTTLPAQTATIA